MYVVEAIQSVVFSMAAQAKTEGLYRVEHEAVSGPKGAESVPQPEGGGSF